MSHCWKLGDLGSSCDETCSDSRTEVDANSCILYSSNYMEEDTLDGWFKAGGGPDDVCLQDGSVKGNSSNSSNNYPGAYISSGNCYFKDKDYERGLLGGHLNCNTKYETNKPLCKCKSTSTVCTGTPSDQEGKQSSIIKFSLDMLAEEVIGPEYFPYSRDAASFTGNHGDETKWLHILKTERISEDKGLTNSFHNWILEIIDPSYPNGSYFFFKYSYQGYSQATIMVPDLDEFGEWYNPIEDQEGLQEQLSSIKFSEGYQSGDSRRDIICPKITKDVTQYKLYRMFASTHKPENRIPHNVGFPPTTKTDSTGIPRTVVFCQEEYYRDHPEGNCEAIWDDYHSFELGGRNFSNIQHTDTDIYNNTLLLSFRNNNTVSFPSDHSDNRRAGIYQPEHIESSPGTIDYNDIFFSVIKDYKVGDRARTVGDGECEDQTRLDVGWHCSNDKKFQYDGRLAQGIPNSKRGLFSITRRKNLNGESPIALHLRSSGSTEREYSPVMLKNYYIARKPPFGISFDTSVTALTPEPPIYQDIGTGWFENIKKTAAAAAAAAAGNSETTTTATPSPGEEDKEDDFFSLDNNVFVFILIFVMSLCFGGVAAIALL